MAVSKVILNGNTLMDVTQKTVTSASMLNGVTALKNDGTDIVGSYVAPTFATQSKTVSPSTSQQTVSPDSGYDGLSSVTVNAMPSGTAGTPTATKGTVSNHSVSVTPSVTNTSGYITGGTKSGTAATVSASELVSGTKSITENGTGIDVTNYAAVDVNVSAGGGASNIVTGTFTGTSNGALAIDTGYTGNGYPIAFFIFCSDGKLTNPRTGMEKYVKVLNDTGNSASYSTMLYLSFNNSTASSKDSAGVAFTYQNAYNGANLAAVMPSTSTLSVYIGSEQYNFTINKPYIYVVVYSE